MISLMSTGTYSIPTSLCLTFTTELQLGQPPLAREPRGKARLGTYLQMAFAHLLE